MEIKKIEVLTILMDYLLSKDKILFDFPQFTVHKNPQITKPGS